MKPSKEKVPAEPTSGVVSSDAWGASFARSIEQQRSRARDLLRTERERIRRTETTLSELAQDLSSELLASEAHLDQAERELASRSQEIEQLRGQLAASQAELARLLDRSPAPDTAFHGEQEELRLQLARAHKQLNLRASELKELRSQLAVAASREGNDQQASLAKELVDLQAERQALLERLADAESQLGQASLADSTEIDDLRRRFEMAVQDVRELKTKNAELEQQITKYKQRPAGSPPVIDAGGAGWEAQKRRVLAQLEAESDGIDSQREHERVTITNTLQITEEALAAKDRELHELRQILEAQSSNLREGMAVGASALTELFDKDELILQQREVLRKLEEEWRDKLRKSEVEISVERAKLAREKTLLNEQLQNLEAERARITPSPADNEANTGKTAGGKGKGNRWLTRLGLSDNS